MKLFAYLSIFTLWHNQSSGHLLLYLIPFWHPCVYYKSWPINRCTTTSSILGTISHTPNLMLILFSPKHHYSMWVFMPNQYWNSWNCFKTQFQFFPWNDKYFQNRSGPVFVKSLYQGSMVIIMTTIYFPVCNLSPNNSFLKMLSTKKKREKRKGRHDVFQQTFLPKWFTKYLETLWKINFRTKSLFMTGFWSLVPSQNRGI